MQDQYSTPLQSFLRQKWVRITLAINALIILFVIAIIIINLTRVSTVTLNIAPIDATISINGDSNYTNGVYSMTPGSYEIQITHSELEPKKISVDIPPHHEIKISTFLSSDNNDLSFYTRRENLKSYEKLREIASPSNNITIDHDTSAEDFVSYYEHSYEIYEMLPIIDFTPSENGKFGGVKYETDTLTIADGRTLAECTTIMCLYITDTSGNKEVFAVSLIEKFNFDPKAYQIIYKKVDYED